MLGDAEVFEQLPGRVREPLRPGAAEVRGNILDRILEGRMRLLPCERTAQEVTNGFVLMVLIISAVRCPWSAALVPGAAIELRAW